MSRDLASFLVEFKMFLVSSKISFCVCVPSTLLSLSYFLESVDVNTSCVSTSSNLLFFFDIRDRGNWLGKVLIFHEISLDKYFSSFCTESLTLTRNSKTFSSL